MPKGASEETKGVSVVGLNCTCLFMVFYLCLLNFFVTESKLLPDGESDDGKKTKTKVWALARKYLFLHI